MKKVKKLGLILCMAFIAMFTSAQTRFGVRAGIGETSLIQKMGVEYRSGERFGYNFGGLMDMHLYKKLSFRPELSFAYQGGSYLSNRDITGEHGLLGEYTVLNKASYYSLQLPVNLALTFKISDVDLSVYAGPVLDYRLSGKLKPKDLTTNTDLQDKSLKSFDLGVDLGLTVEYSKLFFNINALGGCLDRRTEKHNEESAVYQNNVTFSLGYFFR